MTTIANDIHSLIGEVSIEDIPDLQEEECIFDEGPFSYYYMRNSVCSNESALSEQISNYSLNRTTTSALTDMESSAFPPPKAIFFNASADPITTRKHHIQIFSDDLSFSTILKEDITLTVEQVIQKLSTKFLKQFEEYEDEQNWMICLRDESNETDDIVLYNSDKLIKIQNTIFRSMWIDDKELPNAILKFKHSFKFIIKKI